MLPCVCMFIVHNNNLNISGDMCTYVFVCVRECPYMCNVFCEGKINVIKNKLWQAWSFKTFLCVKVVRLRVFLKFEF